MKPSRFCQCSLAFVLHFPEANPPINHTKWCPTTLLKEWSPDSHPHSSPVRDVHTHFVREWGLEPSVLLQIRRRKCNWRISWRWESSLRRDWRITCRWKVRLRKLGQRSMGVCGDSQSCWLRIWMGYRFCLFVVNRHVFCWSVPKRDLPPQKQEKEKRWWFTLAIDGVKETCNLFDWG